MGTRSTWLYAGLGSVLLMGLAQAEESYLSCDVATTFHRPAPNNTEWTHRENDYTKIFKLDSTAKTVGLYNRRSGEFAPICSSKNSACAVSWNGNNISIDGSKAPDSPVPPYLDFRRSFELKGNQVKYVMYDFGNSGKNTLSSNIPAGQANMSWWYEGSCKATQAPAPVVRNAGGMGAGGAPGPQSRNPNYVDAGMALPVSQEEADKALAGYYGNTMWGYSGGKHWFHMWFLEGSLAFTGDDEDMTGMAKPNQWYVGKDSSGYRLCGMPIPATGASGCYPLPVRKLGESWVQHDMDGDAYFSLLPGRQ
ncbi:MAG: hypothetical protein QM808_08460 [Steroidobacteraceae bacterium]